MTTRLFYPFMLFLITLSCRAQTAKPIGETVKHPAQIAIEKAVGPTDAPRGLHLVIRNNDILVDSTFIIPYDRITLDTILKITTFYHQNDKAVILYGSKVEITKSAKISKFISKQN